MVVRKSVKSESGASMSQYDQEVEKRLQALEGGSHSHTSNDSSGGDDDRLSALENKVDDLITKLSKKMSL